MASLFKNADGTFSLQFAGHNDTRKTIRVGKLKREALEIQNKVEALIGAKLSNTSMLPELAAWVGRLDGKLRKQLERHGLIGNRPAAAPARAVAPLGVYFDSFMAIKASLKENTKKTFGQSRKALVGHFGEDRPIDQINAGDAEEWFEAIRGGYSSASLATFLKKARQVFGHAVKKEVLKKNPFLGIKLPSMANKAREEFVSLETIAKVIGAAPDAEWRALISLARHGGLRTPSESLALEWSSVDWAAGRVTVHSPKLEHLPGGGVRVIPLFPELRRHLEEAYEMAKDGATHVIARYRDPGVNLRTQFQKIIGRAGVEPWGRLWTNLRSSRETELMENHPAHVVAGWIGHTEKVASKHYLQIRDSDFDRALEVVQNPVHASARKALHTEENTYQGIRETAELPGNARDCDLLRHREVSPTGVEPVTFGFGGQRSIQLSYGDKYRGGKL